MLIFCPRCKEKITNVEKRLYCCQDCGFHLYINPALCNAVILQNEKKEILFVKRKYPPKRGYWDLPGGFVDYYETLEDSVVREIKEELGIIIMHYKYLCSYPDVYLYKGITYQTLNTVFIAKVINQRLKPNDDITDAQFFSRNQIPLDKIAFPYIKKLLNESLFFV